LLVEPAIEGQEGSRENPVELGQLLGAEALLEDERVLDLRCGALCAHPVGARHCGDCALKAGVEVLHFGDEGGSQLR
jgi:hypothetical protein